MGLSPDSAETLIEYTTPEGPIGVLRGSINNAGHSAIG